MQLAKPSSTLQLSPSLYRWMKEDHAWKGYPFSRRLRAAFDARLFSFNWSVAERLIPSSPQTQKISPVLIVGLWRSGTTALHELLASALNLGTPLTYQCMAPSQLHLGTKARSQAQTTRPMDGQGVSTLSPQEDEFALLALGVPSLYRFFLMPHRLKELSSLLDEHYWVTHDSWLPIWHRFLGMVCHQNGQDTVLVKSPNHTFRLASILRAHPNAKVIWMTREPDALYRSNLGMWKAMSKMYGWSVGNDQEIAEFVTRAICVGTDLLQRYTTQLPSEQLLVVDQSELLHTPRNTVLDIAKWLDPTQPLDEDRIDWALSQTASPNAPPGNGTSSHLPKEIAQHVKSVHDSALRECGKASRLAKIN